MSPIALKDPDVTLDYGFDWTDYLAAGETITSSAWAIEGGDVQLLFVNATNAAGMTNCFVSGGTKGQVYTLRNRITTDQGRSDERSWTIRVEPR